jgi:hypothetical protein
MSLIEINPRLVTEQSKDAELCYCGALVDAPHMHTCGFAWRELFDFLRYSPRIARRVRAAWGVS